jgi:hypothetical protein
MGAYGVKNGIWRTSSESALKSDEQACVHEVIQQHIHMLEPQLFWLICQQCYLYLQKSL